jgi:hypothetical protein
MGNRDNSQRYSKDNRKGRQLIGSVKGIPLIGYFIGIPIPLKTKSVDLDQLEI